MPNKYKLTKERETSRFRGLKRIWNQAIYGNLEANLLEAARQGDSPAVSDWLKRGADLELIGEEATISAARLGHDNTVGILLGCGVNPKCLPEDAKPRIEYFRAVNGAPLSLRR